MPVKTSGHDNDDCPDCRTQRLHFDSVNTLGFYRGDLREAVLLMKRSQYEVLTMSVAAVLADRMSESLLHDPPDLVVPVPMHWSRRVLRGVNTAELLAEPVAVRCAVPLARDLLVCCRKTKKQGTLGPQERIANVRGAFRASASYVIKGANILLLDDVMTTGATVNEAARICRLAGARSVRVAVVARGVGIE